VKKSKATSRIGRQHPPPAGAELLKEVWRSEYDKRIYLFWNELIDLNHYVFYLERITAFPWSLFGESGDSFWDYVTLAMFDSAVLIASRVCLDTRKNSLKLTEFRDEITKNLVSKKERSKFVDRHREVDFDGKMSEIGKQIKDLRNKRIAHLSKEIVGGSIKGSHFRQSVSLSGLREITNCLNEFFQVLSLGIGREMTLPNPDQDIDRVLYMLARNSDVLNMLEQQPEFWPCYKENLSNADLLILNDYRRKFGLPEVE